MNLSCAPRADSCAPLPGCIYPADMFAHRLPLADTYPLLIIACGLLQGKSVFHVLYVRDAFAQSEKPHRGRTCRYL
jgi:hypothetical protein